MAVKLSRGELMFRLLFSLFGLMLLVFAVLYRGMPQGPAMFEVIGVAGVFFGASAAWSGWKLMKYDAED